MFLSITVIILTSVSLYMTEIQDCNCIDCKEVIEGEFAGVYILGDDMSHQADCRGEACLYTEQDTGRGLCFCDPGNVTYELCKATTTTTTTSTTTTTTSTMTTSNQECTEDWLDQYRGKRKSNTRIVGGVAVTDTKRWPWMVAVGNDCGGAIISCQHILTARHCVVGKEFVVMMNSTESNHTTISFNHTKIILLNETCGNFTFKNFTFFDYPDVAIIKLKEKLSRKDVIEGIMRPIRLPTRALTESDTYWNIGYGGIPSLTNNQLHETNKLKLQADTHCEGLPPFWPYMPKCDLCIKTIGPPSPTSTCAGDSGSPGMITIDDRWYVQGVVSRIVNGSSSECDIGTSFIDVAVHKQPVLDWIKANID